jgi:hypothetical protein
MGFSLSWIAVNGRTPQIVRAALRLRGTGVREDVPDAPLLGAELPGGWYLIIANRAYPRFMHDAVLERLSVGCQVVTCFVEEHVMESAASCWKDGRLVWAVRHDSQKDIEHLETKGDLPPMFAPIHDELCARQIAAGGRSADVDYTFDVPAELAKTITGYRHDRVIPETGETPFEVLVTMKTQSPRLPWWRRLISKRREK